MNATGWRIRLGRINVNINLGLSNRPYTRSDLELQLDRPRLVGRPHLASFLGLDTQAQGSKRGSALRRLAPSKFGTRVHTLIAVTMMERIVAVRAMVLMVSQSQESFW